MKPTKAFPVLRGLLKKYNLTYEDYAKILGLTLNSVALKMNGRVFFSLSEGKKTRDYFRSRGENITVDEIFLTECLQ